MVQSWNNADGLYRKFGPDAATATIVGEYKTFGPMHTTEVKTLTLSSLTTTETIIGDVCLIPKGAWLDQVEVEVTEAAAGGTSVSVGLVKQTDRSTTLGAGGLLNAEVTANLTLGKVLLYDASTTNHGTLLGTATSDSAFISAKVAGTFTAGKLIVRVKYRMP